MRAVLGLVAALLAVEAAMWSVLAPLLALYGDEYGLSQAAAGLLNASYTAGVTVSACAGLMFLRSWQPRPAITTGLVVLSAATVAFALAPSVPALIAARVVQGLAGGQVWVGGYSWLYRVGPAAHRGRHVGLAVGASALGTVLGPVVGTVASATDPTRAFLILAAAIAALLPCVLLLPSPATAALDRLDLTAFRSPDTRLSLWLVALLSLPIGLTVAVAPLRLRDLALSRSEIGVTFLAASALGCVVSISTGYLADRHGRRPVLLAGLVGLAPCLLALAFSASPVVVAVATVALIGCFYGLAMPGAVAMLGERLGLAGSPLAAPGLTLITITAAETVGSAGGAALAALFLSAPFVVLAVAMLWGAGLLWIGSTSV